MALYDRIRKEAEKLKNKIDRDKETPGFQLTKNPLFVSRSSSEGGYKPSTALKAGAAAQDFLSNKLTSAPGIGNLVEAPIRATEGSVRAVKARLSEPRRRQKEAQSALQAGELRKQAQLELKKGNIDRSRELSNAAYRLEQESASRQIGFGEDVINQMKRTGSASFRTGLEALGLKYLGAAKPSQKLLTFGLPTAIGAGASALQGENPIVGALNAAGNVPKFAGLNALTNPVIAPLTSYAGSVGGPISRVALRAAASGQLNVWEDQLYAYLGEEGRSLSDSEKKLSFWLGAGYGAATEINEIRTIKKAWKSAMETGNPKKLYDLDDRVTLFKGRRLKGGPDDIIRTKKFISNMTEEGYNSLSPENKRTFRQTARGLLSQVAQTDTKVVDKMSTVDIIEELQRQATKQGGDLGYARLGSADNNKAKLTSEEEPKATLKEGQKERGFYRTTLDSDVTDPEVKARLKEVDGAYSPVKNSDQIRQAQINLDTEGYEAMKARAINGTDLDPQSNADALIVMKRAQEEGRYDDVVDIIRARQELGTKSGQFTQTFSLWNRLTPEGMLRYANAEITDAQENMSPATKFIREKLGKPTEDIELTEEDAKQISKYMKQANAAGSEEEAMKHTKKALEVINQKIPWGVSDYLDEYRYNNMLSNPKTSVRNVYSNAFNTLITRPATLVAEGKFTEAGAYYKGMWSSLEDGRESYLQAIRGETPIEKPDLSELNRNKLPEQFTFPSRFTEAQDKFFSSLIQGGMEEAGISAADAKKAAEYSLYRQGLHSEEQGWLLNKIDDVTSWLYKAPKWARWFVPFIRTPMNIMKQQIEYSPAGVATMPGAKNQSEQQAKTILGTVAFTLGAMAAGEGKTTWTSPTDQTAKSLFYASGRKPFSIFFGKDPDNPQEGEKWVPMWWFGPFGLALGMAAASKYYSDQSDTALSDTELDKLTEGVTGLLKFITSQTSLTGLNNFARLATGDVDFSVQKNLAFTASQTVPWTGFLKYISTVVDPVYRNPSGFAEQFMSGIPGATFNMESYKEPDGSEARREPINYFVPYDIGVPDSRYQVPLKGRLTSRQYSRKKTQIIKDIGRMDYSELQSKYPEDALYYAAEQIYSDINKLKPEDLEGKKALVKEYEARGYTGQEIAKEIDRVVTMDKYGLSKTDREMLLLPPLVRAQRIVDRMDGVEKKRALELLELYRRFEIMTPEVEQLIIKIKEQE